MTRLWKKLTGLPVPITRVEADLGIGFVRARRSTWPYRSVRETVSRPVESTPGDPLWRGATRTLDNLLSEWGPMSGELRVTLSNRFVRYLMLPANADIKGENEQVVYARHHFVERFGVDAEGWEIRLHEQKNDINQLFTCAIEAELLAELNRVAAAHRLVLETAEPAIANAFNANAIRIGKARCWFVVLEEGNAAIGLVENGSWCSVANRRLDGSVEQSLVRALITEQQMIGAESPIDSAMIARYGSKQPLPPMLADWRVQVMRDCGLTAA